MVDLISRQEAIEAIQNLYPDMPIINVCNSLNRWYEKNKQYIECEDAIDKLPPVQPERLTDDDLISRQAAIDALKEYRAFYCDNTPDAFSKLSYAEKCRVNELDMAIATLVNLPSKQSEQKKGKWFNYQGNTKIVLCSECRMPALESMTGCLSNQHLAPNRTNFCPNCGADMKEEEN